MNEEDYRNYKSRYDICEATAYNFARIITDDNGFDFRTLNDYKTICKLFEPRVNAEQYISMMKTKKGSSYLELTEKYSHSFSASEYETNMWSNMLMYALVLKSHTFMDNLVKPYMDVMLEIVKTIAEGLEYMNQYRESLTSTIEVFSKIIAKDSGENCASNTDSIAIRNNDNARSRNMIPKNNDAALPLKVVKVGGTTGAKDRNGYFNALLGVDIENPNKTKMASNISLEITLTDAEGNIVDVITDTLYCIDAGTTFHYGTEKVWMHGKVGRISASAYAGSFFDVGDIKFMDGTKFTNPAVQHGDGDCTLTGWLKSNYTKNIENCYVYYQYIENGKIVGGNYETINFLPAGATRAIKSTSTVDVKMSSFNYSIDFDLSSIL